MKPVDQDRFGAPDGNCWTACVASIAERSLADLGHLQEAYRAFAECHENREWKERDRWWSEVMGDLARMGFCLIRLPAETVPRGYSVMSGLAPRGLQHSVVALDGVMVHDPHPSRDGLSGPVEDWEVLLPIMPGRDKEGARLERLSNDILSSACMGLD